MKKLLLIVDLQYDFIDKPNIGKLAVEGSGEMSALLEEHLKSEKYDGIAFTLDWHPYNHSSFIKYGGAWPSHCIQHSQGASIHEGVLNISHQNCPNNVTFWCKGEIIDKDEYSIFQNYTVQSKLLNHITNEDYDLIEVCGLAGDYCVKNTIIDLINYKLSSKIKVLTKFIRSIDNGTELNKLIEDNKLKHD